MRAFAIVEAQARGVAGREGVCADLRGGGCLRWAGGGRQSGGVPEAAGGLMAHQSHLVKVEGFFQIGDLLLKGGVRSLQMLEFLQNEG